MLKQALKWLDSQGYQYQNISTVAGDASFRKYYRLHQVNQFQQNLNCNLILLVSPPEKEKNNEFIEVAKKFKQCQINSVEIIDYYLKDGFLLLTDLGEMSLYDEVSQDYFQTKSLDFYYSALKILTDFQNSNQIISKNLSIFNSRVVRDEMNLFDEWLIKKMLGRIDLSINQDWKRIKPNLFSKIEKQFLKIPTSFTHRDFHSKNLMADKKKCLSVIDFQDALIGPCIYDLISLLKDSYIALPETIYQILNQKAFEIYRHQFEDYNQFLDACHWVQIQRHIKVLGIFSRLSLRDQKKAYLNFIPQTLYYLKEEVKKYEQLTDFKLFLENKLIPTWFEFSIKNDILI